MKQMKVFIYILVTAFILSSCSIQKRCQAPELNLPDEIIAGENDTLTIADMSWWELYSDSTLSKLIKKTLRNNRNMQAAEAHIRQMEELYRVSKASSWPTIGAQLFADHETNDYYGEKFTKDPEFSLKASLGWEIDLWGSLRWGKRKGAAEYLASVEAARAMQMTLIAETATAYFELVALDQELEIVLQTVKTREESVNQARLRFEGGLTSETAYQQAQVELASASALIPELEQKIPLKESGTRRIRLKCKFTRKYTYRASLYPTATKARCASSRATATSCYGGSRDCICRSVSTINYKFSRRA